MLQEFIKDKLCIYDTPVERITEIDSRGIDIYRYGDATTPQKRPISCDKCAKPGACCNSFNIGMTVDDIKYRYNDIESVIEQGINQDWPIMPWGVGKYDGLVRFRCSALTRGGRCSIYDIRGSECKGYDPEIETLCLRINHKQACEYIVSLFGKDVENDAYMGRRYYEDLLFNNIKLFYLPILAFEKMMGSINGYFPYVILAA